jgi:hypothetical protein
MNSYSLPLILQQFQSLDHPNLNLPTGDASHTNHEDSALPSIQHDHDHHTAKTGHDAEHGEHAAAAGGHGGHKVPDRYPVTSVDFLRVETPFIIGIWILFASIAKIGEFKSVPCSHSHTSGILMRHNFY